MIRHFPRANWKAYSESMADAPLLEITDLLVKLQGIRDRARDSGSDDIYIDLIEACAICEALANPEGDWNNTVDIRDVAARLRRQGLHVVNVKRD
jgi:hypothetical protein